LTHEVSMQRWRFERFREIQGRLHRTHITPKQIPSRNCPCPTVCFAHSSKCPPPLQPRLIPKLPVFLCLAGEGPRYAQATLLSSLEPNTAYYFLVSVTSVGEISSPFSFRTLPTSGEVHFVIGGDSGTEPGFPKVQH